VYPRTLASLFGSEGDEVVWKHAFLLFLGTLTIEYPAYRNRNALVRCSRLC
jgi:hypothetical protein